MGESIDDMNDKELAVCGAVTSKLGKSGIKAGNSLSKQVAGKLYKDNNKYLFNKYNSNGSVEYVPLKSISDCTSFRYFYDDSKSIATMTSGSTVYIFKRCSNQMYKQSTAEDPESMSGSVVYQGELFISETDAKKYFSCDAEYLSGTNYAVCVTGTMQTAVDNSLESIIESIN